MLFLENLEQELVCALEVVCGVSEADIVLAVGSINHKVGNAVGLVEVLCHCGVGASGRVARERAIYHCRGDKAEVAGENSAEVYLVDGADGGGNILLGDIDVAPCVLAGSKTGGKCVNGQGNRAEAVDHLLRDVGGAEDYRTAGFSCLIKLVPEALSNAVHPGLFGVLRVGMLDNSIALVGKLF